MLRHPTIFLLPLVLLGSGSFGDEDGRNILHIDFGSNRTTGLPPATLSSQAVPDVLCTDATFPTGIFCDFHLTLQRASMNFPNLNGTSKLVMNFPHPSKEETVCNMSFIGALFETPARVLYDNISCTPEVADRSIPPVKMSDVTSLEMKLHGGHVVCSLSVYNTTVLSSEDEEKSDISMVGFHSFRAFCALPVFIGRPLVSKVVTVHLPDRIRERPVND